MVAQLVALAAALQDIIALVPQVITALTNLQTFLATL
jgi:hypothetical protein